MQYTPYVTSIFPEPTMYKPDFSFIQQVMERKQTMYDKGLERAQTLYNSVFNSDLIREDNIERRDKYLKGIEDSLKKLSASDLSIVANQQAAEKLFDPVIKDKFIMKDMMFTKKLQSEMSRAEQFRSSSDPELRKQYWDIGVKALQYQAEEFQKADNTSSLRFSNPKYTNNVDLLDISNKLYKDMGISVTKDSISGAYIWTMKNGDLSVPVTKSMLNMMLTSDPSIKDMMLTDAYVKRKDYVKQYAEYTGSEENAEGEYVSSILNTKLDQIDKEYKTQRLELDKLRLKKEKWEKYITEHGIIEGSDDHKKYLQDLNELELTENAADHLHNNYIKYGNLEHADPSLLKNVADDLVSGDVFDNLTNQLASILSYKNMELKAKPDQVGLTQLSHALSLQRQRELLQLKHAYGMDVNRRNRNNNDNNDDNDDDNSNNNNSNNNNRNNNAPVTPEDLSNASDSSNTDNRGGRSD